MSQYCFARWRLSASSSSVGVCNAAGVRAGGAHKRSARRPPGSSAAGRPTLQGGPVRLRPVRATLCFIVDNLYLRTNK